MLRDAGAAACEPKGERPRRHDGVLAFAKPRYLESARGVTTVANTARYDKAETVAWDRMCPGSPTAPLIGACRGLTDISAWHVDAAAGDRLPGDRDLKPVWLSYSAITSRPVDEGRW